MCGTERAQALKRAKPCGNLRRQEQAIRIRFKDGIPIIHGRVESVIKPKIGLSMLYCLGKPFEDMIEQLASVQTEYIEIVDDGYHALNKQRVTTLRSVGASYDFKYSVHAPFADINIASPSRPILKGMVRRLRQSIACANALGAYLWVFHPGLRTGISSFYPGSDWYQNLATVRLLSEAGREYGVKVAIENVPEPFPFLLKNVEDFLRFYSEANEEIGLVLDVGHSNIRGLTEVFFKTFRDKIVHMHISDNDGTSDQHVGIGLGNIDWSSFVDFTKKAGWNKTMIVESIDHAQDSLRRLQQLFA